jgi:hypothetical protein
MNTKKQVRADDSAGKIGNQILNSLKEFNRAGDGAVKSLINHTRNFQALMDGWKPLIDSILAEMPVEDKPKSNSPGADAVASSGVTTPLLADFQCGIKGAIAEIDDQMAGTVHDQDKIFLLSIRQHLSPLMDEGPKNISSETTRNEATPIAAADAGAPKEPFSINFLDMEMAIQEASGILDLLAWRVAGFIEERGGNDDGTIAAGITVTAGDVGENLRFQFDQLFEEYRKAKGPFEKVVSR